MREKEESRPLVAQETGQDGMATGKTHNSYYHSTTVSGDRQSGPIASLLMYGPSSGVTLRRLEKLTGMDNRTIRRQIERERRAGALILSDNQHSYYLTDDPAEAQRFTRSMRHRAREILLTVRAIEKSAGLD